MRCACLDFRYTWHIYLAHRQRIHTHMQHVYAAQAIAIYCYCNRSQSVFVGDDYANTKTCSATNTCEWFC